LNREKRLKESPTHTDPHPTLVRRAQRGDREALRALLGEVSPKVHQWAMARTGDPDEAADLAQEVLVLLLRKLPTYRGDSRFITWLFVVTRNQVIESRRREGRRRRKMELMKERTRRTKTPPAPSSVALDGMRVREIVEAFLTRLPDRQREVFQLADLQGLSSPEIGEILGVEAGTVRVALFKARRTLRKHILEHHREVVEEYLP
jgi:RNA polymerase sigma-70 factor (ECF subfamily)